MFIQKKMEAAAKSLDFIEAARLRDIIKDLKNKKRIIKNYPLFLNYFFTEINLFG